MRHKSDARSRCCCSLFIAATLSSLVALSLIIVAATHSSVECGWCAAGATAVAMFEFGLAYASRERKFEDVGREDF